MALPPVGGTNDTGPVLSGNRENQIDELAAWILQRTGRQDLADSWTTYANKHTKAPIRQVYAAWFFTVANIGGALAKSLAGGLGLGSRIIAAIPGAVGTLSPANLATSFLGRLAEASTWIRVVEGILGLGLIIIGIAKLASNTGVGQLATKAAKVAAIA